VLSFLNSLWSKGPYHCCTWREDPDSICILVLAMISDIPGDVFLLSEVAFVFRRLGGVLLDMGV
jgi:hypothetical protein